MATYPSGGGCTEGFELAKVLETPRERVPHQQFAIDDASAGSIGLVDHSAVRRQSSVPCHADALLKHRYHRRTVDGSDVI
jgi:hypothetical protein